MQGNVCLRHGRKATTIGLDMKDRYKAVEGIKQHDNIPERQAIDSFNLSGTASTHPAQQVVV